MSKDSHTGQPVYSQVLKLLDKEDSSNKSRNERKQAYVKRFDGYQHLVVMLFGILKHFDSLRELEIGMKAEAHKLGHLGMNYLVRRSACGGQYTPSSGVLCKCLCVSFGEVCQILADSRPSKSYKGQTHEPKDWENCFT